MNKKNSMKQIIKNIFGIGVVVFFSVGVVGVIIYMMLKLENRDSLLFNEQFCQNFGVCLVVYDVINVQFVDLMQVVENLFYVVVYIKLI